MSDQCREKSKNPDENDQSPLDGFKFSRSLPMRTTVWLSVVFHRITSLLAGKEVVPSTLPGLAEGSHSNIDAAGLLETRVAACPVQRRRVRRPDLEDGLAQLGGRNCVGSVSLALRRRSSDGEHLARPRYFMGTK